MILNLTRLTVRWLQAHKVLPTYIFNPPSSTPTLVLTAFHHQRREASYPLKALQLGNCYHPHQPSTSSNFGVEPEPGDISRVADRLNDTYLGLQQAGKPPYTGICGVP